MRDDGLASHHPRKVLGAAGKPKIERARTPRAPVGFPDGVAPGFPVETGVCKAAMIDLTRPQPILLIDEGLANTAYLLDLGERPLCAVRTK